MSVDLPLSISKNTIAGQQPVLFGIIDFIVGEQPLPYCECGYAAIDTLAKTKGNREKAAKILGIGERTLYRKIVTVQGLKMSILGQKGRFRMLHYAKTAHIYAKMAKRI